MPIERKYERDVDILLAEEFATNPGFSEKFKALTKFASEEASVADFWVSKSDALGESDLVIVYQSKNGNRFALLIEDKVDARLQVDQAKRYRLRAEKEQASGEYSDFEVILCAPNYYISNRYDLDGFDRKLSFEQIADIIEQPQDKRALYRACFLRTAGTKHINAWQREDDPATNDFWDAAYELASHEFPILEMKRLKLTKDSVWITLRPQDFPTMPKSVCVALKGNHGCVDLTFGKTTAHQFHATIRHLLKPPMIVLQTRASAAIRIETPSFQISEGFANALPKVKAAFEASSCLIAFYRQFQKELNEAAATATPV
jgi:hypothetical protein